MTYSALFLEVVFWSMVVKTLFWDMIMKRINFKAQVLPRALTSVEAFLAEVDPPNLVEFDLVTWRSGWTQKTRPPPLLSQCTKAELNFCCKYEADPSVLIVLSIDVLYLTS